MVKEFCTQILLELQKELGGKIHQLNREHWVYLSDSSDSWCVEIVNRGYDFKTRYAIYDDIYRIWAWNDISNSVSLTVDLSDPNCFQEVIDHLKCDEN